MKSVISYDRPLFLLFIPRMIPWLSRFVLLLGLVRAGFGAEPDRLTAYDIHLVQNTLLSFDNDVLTFDDVIRHGDPEWCLKVVNFYLANPTNISQKSKLPVSRCFVVLDRDKEGVKLATDYLSTYSNDWRAWRIVGAASVAMTNAEAAIQAYTNAIAFGCDSGCVTPLGFCALKVDRLDIVRGILPRLFELKQSDKALSYEPLDAVVVLAIYSVKTDDEKTFVKALTGVTKKEVLSREELKEVVNMGCKEFTSPAAQAICRELEDSSAVSNK